MADASSIREHMEVIGADGVHIGTVDKVEGQRIKLTKQGQRRGLPQGASPLHSDQRLSPKSRADKVRLSANSDVAVTFEEEQTDPT